MGLLDDAIREHLELRRLHGADPSEVASKEHEAFGGPTSAVGENVLAAEPDHILKVQPTTTAEPRRAARWEDAWDAVDGHLSQETVELDMRAVLEEDSRRRIVHAARDERPAMASAAAVRAHR